MKAIILAGGSGTRLHPVSLPIPKPMAALVNKPLLEHIILLLKRYGFKDICMTLRYLPKVITDYFGDGSAWGINLKSHIEEAPLGTAGGIKACESFICNDDILIISGDAACDIDLQKIIDFHYRNGAEATIALYRSASPLEYGLVMTEPDGKVSRFIEKPSRDRVYTDLVNSGIYIISNKLLSEIPANEPFDFARDLFPKLLAAGRPVYGLLTEGYWCDVGSCESYLRANMDALSGRLPIDFEAPETRSGIWSKTALPRGVICRAPCYIGENCRIAKGAVIGPYAVIGANSSIAEGVEVISSIVDSAVLDSRCSLRGAIVCKGAKIGSESRLLEGSVVGQGTVLAPGCLVSDGVHIWPDKRVPEGERVRAGIMSGMAKTAPLFETRGVISCETGIEITPETALSMGAAAAEQSVGISYTGGHSARITAESFGLGASSAGSELFCLDCACAATAAFASRSYALPMSLFAEQHGKRLVLRFFGSKGLPISRGAERKLENAVPGATGISAERIGGKRLINGTAEAHAAAAASCVFKTEGKKPGIRVEGKNCASRLLMEAFRLAGFETDEAAPARLEISADGLYLTLRDEAGSLCDHNRLLLALALTEAEYGKKEIALPYFAPASADELASRHGAKVLRLYRDGDIAERLMAERPYASDAVFLALRLASAAQFYGGTFAKMTEGIPRCFMARREVRTVGDRGRLMRELHGFGGWTSYELVSGLKLNTGRGFAYVLPGAGNLLSIRAEAAAEEIAEEICIDIENKVKKINAAAP